MKIEKRKKRRKLKPGRKLLQKSKLRQKLIKVKQR